MPEFRDDGTRIRATHPNDKRVETIITVRPSLRRTVLRLRVDMFVTDQQVSDATLQDMIEYFRTKGWELRLEDGSRA